MPSSKEVGADSWDSVLELLPFTSFERRSSAFDLLPIFQYFAGILRSLVAKNMRVPAHHFLVDFANHVGGIKAFLLRSDLRVKHNLQQQVAQFFGKLRIVAAFQRFQKLRKLLQSSRFEDSGAIARCPTDSHSGRANALAASPDA